MVWRRSRLTVDYENHIEDLTDVQREIMLMKMFKAICMIICMKLLWVNPTLIYHIQKGYISSPENACEPLFRVRMLVF